MRYRKKWQLKFGYASADPEGGTGGPDPPGKSQVIWVSMGNKQLDPSCKKLDLPPPPPPPWKMLDPLEPWNDRFPWNWPFDFCKISWGLKKKKLCQSFFVWLTWTPPWRKFLDPHMVPVTKASPTNWCIFLTNLKYFNCFMFIGNLNLFLKEIWVSFCLSLLPFL